jgi:tRNA nucleotidyltransferase (CCA-adding enzyme)
MNSHKSLASGIERLSLGRLGEALKGVDAYLVGGAARSLIAGQDPDGDIDIAVVGELDPLLDDLKNPARRHDRFATAVVPLDGDRHADLARTRTETYEFPGALPVVAPATIDQDLERRDFTVNAIAIELAPPNRVIDPFDGAADLESATLRVLHRGSFDDDPTRAIRAARYCTRLGLDPDPQSLELLAAVDLSLVSADRRQAELGRLAAEQQAAAGFTLLSGWGVLSLEEDRLGLIKAIDERAMAPRWASAGGVREVAIIRVVEGGERLEAALGLATEHPVRPSEAVRVAMGSDPAALLIAEASGAEWVGPYVTEWSATELVIDGDDLIAAGIDPGPPVGAGLKGALELKLDGHLEGGRDAELEAALRIARAAI